ncbi:MAG: hypothetical protein PHE89_07160, partial [Alphaproteobacteria bacterium]|nr:hypothetical protein [Alphaproteobacteria bacterium]
MKKPYPKKLPKIKKQKHHKTHFFLQKKKKRIIIGCIGRFFLITRRIRAMKKSYFIFLGAFLLFCSSF